MPTSAEPNDQPRQRPEHGLTGGRGQGPMAVPWPARAYLRTESDGIAPPGLQRVLYDSALGLARRALEALEAGRNEAAADLLRRAHRVVQGLGGPLRSAAGERAADFAALYRLVSRRLIEAGHYRRRQTLHQTIRLLDFYRPAWNAFLAEAAPAPSDGRGGPTAEWIG